METVAGYERQFFLVDDEMESDLFALSTYRFEFETADQQESLDCARCEKITVYNPSIDAEASWLNIKFY